MMYRAVKSYQKTHPCNRCMHQLLTVQLYRASVLLPLADNTTSDGGICSGLMI